MSYLAQAIGELKSQIHAYLQQSTNELVRFQVKLDKVDLLAWLKGQSAYPQFYLHFRDEEKSTGCAWGSAVIFTVKFSARVY